MRLATWGHYCEKTTQGGYYNNKTRASRGRTPAPPGAMRVRGACVARVVRGCGACVVRVMRVMRERGERKIPSLLFVVIPKRVAGIVSLDTRLARA